MTILEAAQALRQRSVSSAELTEAALRRTGETNPKINAMITVLDQSDPATEKSHAVALLQGSLSLAADVILLACLE